jgi:hypothetical protein
MAKLITPVARLSFPSLFRPQEGEMGGGKYGCTLLFAAGADLSALKAAAKEAVVAKWGNKPPKNLRTPFRDGNEKELDGYKDTIYLRVTCKTKPGVVDASVQPILDEAEIYPGCYVRASVSCYAYEKSGNVGVSFGLNNIQKVKDGERFDGKSRAEDEFGAVDEDKSASSSGKSGSDTNGDLDF